MSDDETEADIVVQLDALANYAERADHWKDDMRLMDAAGVADTVYGAIDRIEELEAKLAQAVEALKMDPWFLGYGCWKKHVKDTLAELTGGKDE